ncbi:MAG: hypothetical protein DMG88_22375 [Acidobacteria bacterium]|nr:MAG: hypothetical protein DMG88_22375 [Acidobacteriota bacterium]
MALTYFIFFFIFFLTGTSFGCTIRANRLSEVASAASESNFVFRGTVKKPGGTTLEVVPASASTAIVHVDEILDGSQTSGDFTDQDITVELRQAPSVREGQQLVFFSNGVAFGASIAVREVNHVDAKQFTPQGLAQVTQAAALRPQREVQARIAQADLVVTGTILSFKPAAGEEGRVPASEHDAQWWQAEVAIENTEKGKAAGNKVVVYVPHSDDIRWFRAPKVEVGQQGVFLLHRTSIPALKLEGYTATSSLDVQPMEQRQRIQNLLRNP